MSRIHETAKIINHLYAYLFLGDITIYFAFSFIPRHWDDIGSLFFIEVTDYLFYIDNTMAADDLGTEGARASTAMLLI